MDAYLKDQLDFTGVKVALLVEKSILVVLRDNKPEYFSLLVRQP